jgi:hypothetical protein
MNASLSKIALIGLFAATSAFAGVASAQSPERISDVAYIAAARCEGLAQGAKLDTSAIKKLMVVQDNDRLPYIEDKADQARDDAKRMASRSDGYTKESVSAELNGPCQAYLKS